MIDEFYTPPELARLFVRCLPQSFRPEVVVDFAAGHGSLLDAAQDMWPLAQKVANDLSPATVRRLKSFHPRWAVANADFLSDRSVRRSILRRYLGQVDLVLLNPPFSQRSRTPQPVTYRGECFGASLAVAFLVKSLEFVNSDGYLVAVLPDGCLVGKCDEQVWKRLKDDFHIEVLRDNANSTFRGVRARTSLVRISRIRQDTHASSRPEITCNVTASYELRRGQMQMHSVKPSKSQRALPLVHTSHLVHGHVSLAGPHVIAKNPVSGPAVLVPRVGRITPTKVCVLETGRSVVLSDCVIAIKLSSNKQALRLRGNILDQWASFAETYRGTGAPHLTLGRALGALQRIEELVAAADVAGRTSCESVAAIGEGIVSTP